MIRNHRKKSLLTAFLLGVFCLLLFQEVVLHPVWCYKTDGSVDLEWAFAGFDCGCCCDPENPNDHAHMHDHGSACEHDHDEPQLTRADSHCFFDQPVEDGNLKRVLPDLERQVSLHAFGSVFFQEDIIIQAPYVDISWQVPLRKFLNLLPGTGTLAVMRC